MKKKITAFIPFSGSKQTIALISSLQESELVNKIFLMIPKKGLPKIQGCKNLLVDNLRSSKAMKLISKNSQSEYIFYISKDSNIELGKYCLDRFYQVAENTETGILYSNYRETTLSGLTENLLIKI